jgi:hypothetical protein
MQSVSLDPRVIRKDLWELIDGKLPMLFWAPAAKRADLYRRYSESTSIAK